MILRRIILPTLLLLSGCDREPQSYTGDFSVWAVLGDVPASRAQVGVGHVLTWQEGDLLGVVSVRSSGGFAGPPVAYRLTEGASTKRGVFTGPDPGNGATCFAVHLNRGRIYVDGDFLVAELYDAAGSLDLVSGDVGNHLLMTSGIVPEARFAGSELVFAHQCSLFEFYLGGAPATDGKGLESITLSATASDFVLAAAYDAQGGFVPAASRFGDRVVVRFSDRPVLCDGKDLVVSLPVMWNPATEVGGGRVLTAVFAFADGSRYRVEKPLREFLPGVCYQTSFSPGAAWDGALTEPASIDPAERRIMIYSAAELAWVANEVGVVSSVYDRFEGWTLTLGRDIDLGGQTEWQPIGQGSIDTSDKRFRGTFDGAGHVVSGLCIRGNTAQRGLFCFLQYPGVICNLTVRGSVSGGPQTAGICAYNSGGRIENCVSEVEVISDKQYAGGICATNASAGSASDPRYGLITGCVNWGRVSAVNGNAGGIVGSNAGGLVVGCRNEGAVASASAGGVGGIAGQNVAGSGTSEYAVATDALISASLHAGSTVTTGHSAKGFVAGRNNVGQTIENCYFYTTDISIPDNASGVSGANPAGSLLVGSGALGAVLWPSAAAAGWGEMPPAKWVGEWRTPWGYLGGWNGGNVELPKLVWE